MKSQSSLALPPQPPLDAPSLPGAQHPSGLTVLPPALPLPPLAWPGQSQSRRGLRKGSFNSASPVSMAFRSPRMGKSRQHWNQQLEGNTACADTGGPSPRTTCPGSVVPPGSARFSHTNQELPCTSWQGKPSAAQGINRHFN